MITFVTYFLFLPYHVLKKKTIYKSQEIKWMEKSVTNPTSMMIFHCDMATEGISMDTSVDC
jgi:hypothetical protein